MAISSPLDDFEKIKMIDKSDLCGTQFRFPENCEDAIKIAEKLKIPRRLRISRKVSINYGKPERILVAGMGGSAIVGDILRTWLSDYLPIPISVSRDYHLPAYADNKTLVFAVSYSGRTEETLSSFIEAVQRRCMVIGISSGGSLQKFCQKLKIPFFKLPENMLPRAAIPYLFFSLVIAIEKLGVLKDRRGEIAESLVILKKVREETKPETPTPKNIAKQIALQIKGTVPVIYGFGSFESIALRVKTQFNENSKVPAKYGVFPELNHNEIVGWRGPPELTKIFSIILIRDSDEPPEIKARIDLTKKLALKGKVSKILELYARGRSKLAKMLSAMYIGDFTSIYLAILYEVDPATMEVITNMKEELKRKVKIPEKIERQFHELTKGEAP
jgi:glucose/mannose-6-phosphate isomerase